MPNHTTSTRQTFVIGRDNKQILESAEASHPVALNNHRGVAAKLQQQSRETSMLSISALSAMTDIVLSVFSIPPLIKATAIVGMGAITSLVVGERTRDALNNEPSIRRHLTTTSSLFSPVPTLNSKGPEEGDRSETLGLAATHINNAAVTAVKNTGFVTSLASAAVNYGASTLGGGMAATGFAAALPGMIGYATERLCQERGRHVSGPNNAVEGHVNQPLTNQVTKRRVTATLARF